MLPTSSSSSSFASSVRKTVNTISLSDEFYQELVTPQPHAVDNMAPSQLDKPDTKMPGKSMRSQKIMPVPTSPIEREDAIPEDEVVKTTSRGQLNGHSTSRTKDKRTSSLSKETRSRSQSHSQAIKSPTASGRTTPQYAPAPPSKDDVMSPRRPSSRRQTESSGVPPASASLMASQSAANLTSLSATSAPLDRKAYAIRSSSAMQSKHINASTTSLNTAYIAPSPPAAEPSSTKTRQPSTTPAPASIPKPTPQSPVPKGVYTAFPPLPTPPKTPEDDVPPAPASGMYWSPAPSSGAPHTALRAHTCTLLGSLLYIFGGCDAHTCFNTLYIYDCESFHWSRPKCFGTIRPPPPGSKLGEKGKEEFPMPLRAMTCTAVGKRLVVFGGGDGPKYTNDVWVFDTICHRWSKPTVVGSALPSKRRAHTACLYRNGIYIFGGGDGVRALNDVWRLDVSDLSSGKVAWKLISASSTPSSSNTILPPGSSGSGTDSRSGVSTPNPDAVRGPKPKPRGYHTANIVGAKLIIYGGSDGDSCFHDVWLFDIPTSTWTPVTTITSSNPSPNTLTPPLGAQSKKEPIVHPRLSHTATLVGSYLFVVGGHDGVEYTSEVLCLNLVTMTWDVRRVWGKGPKGRGYHGTVLCDGRLIVVGGFDGTVVFGGGVDEAQGVGEREAHGVWILELGGCAYYSQISCFSIEV